MPLLVPLEALIITNDQWPHLIGPLASHLALSDLGSLPVSNLATVQCPFQFLFFEAGQLRNTKQLPLRIEWLSLSHCVIITLIVATRGQRVAVRHSTVSFTWSDSLDI